MKILEPIKVGNITLKNRIMFTPLTTGYEERDGSIGEHSRNFYTRLAQGGVGYIVVGDVVPCQTVSPTPKLYADNQIESFRKLADGVHQYGAKLGLQIFHPDYDAELITKLVGETFALKAKAKALAEKNDPSAKEVADLASQKEKEAFGKLHYDMLHFVSEVSKEQLGQILEKIKACIKRAVAAGVDVIEVHGDRLVGSLCSTILNHRNDDYGGSFENRTRFALEFVDAIKEADKDITIDYKLPIITKDENGNSMGKGGLYIEEAVELAKLLEKHGVNMIHVAQANHTGNMNDTIPAMGTREYGFMIEYTKKIKEAVSIPVSTVGRITTAEAGETLLQEGVCDIIGFGRSLLADPDIANKIADGKINQIRKCIMCNKGCTDSIMNRKFVSCVLNAENGYEYKRVITKATNPRSIAVVGGGVAGLEACRVLLLKGHHVDLYEKSMKLGGQVNIAMVPPRKDEMKRIINFYEEVLKDQDINIYLNHEFTSEDAKKYDTVIDAIGAHNLVPHIPGIDMDHVVSSWDVLAGKKVVFGKIAICGGGLVGVETAEYLAEKGYSVSIIEMLDSIANGESKTILPTLTANLEKYHVDIHTSSKIKQITKEGVIVDVLDKDKNPIKEEIIKADFVVNALASAKNVLDINESDKLHIIPVGDCSGERPSTIENAIKTAYDAANSIN